MLLHQVEDDIAALQGILWIDKGIIIGSGLEHTHQDGCILRLQVLGRAAEIGLAGSFDTEGVGTEIDGVGIARQNLLLVEEIFQFVGRDPLLALHDEHLQTRYVTQQACGVFGARAEQVLGELLRDGGGTSGIAMQDILLGDSCESGIVDAVMAEETLIFSVDEGVPEDGIHLLVLDRRTILTEELAYQLVVCTIDHRGLGRALVLNG